MSTKHIKKVKPKKNETSASSTKEGPGGGGCVPLGT